MANIKGVKMYVFYHCLIKKQTSLYVTWIIKVQLYKNAQKMEKCNPVRKKCNPVRKKCNPSRKKCNPKLTKCYPM